MLPFLFVVDPAITNVRAFTGLPVSCSLLPLPPVSRRALLPFTLGAARYATLRLPTLYRTSFLSGITVVPPRSGGFRAFLSHRACLPVVQQRLPRGVTRIIHRTFCLLRTRLYLRYYTGYLLLFCYCGMLCIVVHSLDIGYRFSAKTPPTNLPPRFA